MSLMAGQGQKQALAVLIQRPVLSAKGATNRWVSCTSNLLTQKQE